MKFITPILLLSLWLLGGAQSSAQLHTKKKKAIAAYEQGKDYFMFEKYQAAIQKFDEALKIDPGFVECHFIKADLYKQTRNFEEQFKSLKAGVTIDSTAFVTAYYLAAVALCRLGRDTASLAWFDMYKRFEKPKNWKKDTDKWIAHAKFVRHLMDNPVPYDPKPMLPNIKNEFDLYWPSLTLDESELVFTSLIPFSMSQYQAHPDMPRTTRYFQEDFYICVKKDGEWQPPLPMVGVNTFEHNEGAQALSADGAWMFFTGCNWNDGYGRCDLYFSKRTPDGWSRPINIGAPVNTSNWESQPCFSADGQTLYFVSDRPGGYGRNDIWKAKIDSFAANGKPIFGKVENLGPTINTPGNESSPFLHADNKTLYFSSDGWPGIGLSDIFVARRDNDTAQWRKPENIGYPINTNEDELGLVINAEGNRGYYSREMTCEDGIVRRVPLCFELPAQARPSDQAWYITGNVMSARTRRPLAAAIELIDTQSGEKVTAAQSRPGDGYFVLNLPTGREYALLAQCEGYLFHSQNLIVPPTLNENMHVPVLLSPLEEGERVALRNVFFATNSAELKPESFVELDKLVDLLKANPKLKVEIGGHTDNVGSAVNNMDLSRRRAKSTADYIVGRGIDAKRITSKGYGLTQPDATNDTEEGRALNRRVEAKIVGVQ